MVPVCDFCNKPSSFVKRIAIDQNYDRLTLKHNELYACEDCSKKKECERLYGASRGKSKSS